MSYSRWSHSRWYTFWHCESGECPYNQLFAIYDASGPTRYLTPDDLEGIGPMGLKQWFDATEDELQELHGYITEWLGDVHEAFGGTVEDA